MTTKHTPGPWAIDPDDNDYIIDATGNYVCARHACFAASTVDCGSRQDREANARLIAAAPELLAALEDVLPYLEDARMANGARAAIAKAKGDRT